MKTIKVRVKHVYGVPSVYPVCSDAKIFAEIAGTKTLTTNALKLIDQLGYELLIMTQEEEIDFLNERMRFA